MKRIIIFLLFCPLTMMTMEQQTSPRYVGVLADVMGETRLNDTSHLYLCKQDTIVYQRLQNISDIESNMPLYEYVVQITKNHIKPEPTIPKALFFNQFSNIRC